MTASNYQCLAPSRFWKVALGRDVWSAPEAGHLEACERCRQLRDEVTAAVEQKKQADRRVAAALLLIAGLVKNRSRTPLRLPRATMAFDTGPDQVDFVSFDFEDQNLKAVIECKSSDRSLLHVEDRRHRPGDLLLAAVKTADGRAVWSRFLVLRARRHPEATARLDPAALRGEGCHLYLDAVAAPPPGSADLLRESFEAAQADDPAALKYWKGWANATLEAGAGDAALREVLESIRDVSPAKRRDEPGTGSGA